MGGESTTNTTNERKISSDLKGPSQDLIRQMEMYGNVNPWKLDYRGPEMAAVNQAQIDRADGAAAAGNAFNMGFTPASQFLPEATEMNGMQAYDVRKLAKQGVSPAMEKLLDQFYKGNSGNSGGGRGRGGSQFPGNGRGTWGTLFNDPRQTGRDRNGNAVSGATGIEQARMGWSPFGWRNQ